MNPQVIELVGGYKFFMIEKMNLDIKDKSMPNRIYGGSSAEYVADISADNLLLKEGIQISKEDRDKLAQLLTARQAFPIWFGYLKEKGLLTTYTKRPEAINARPYIDLNSLLPTMDNQDIKGLLDYADQFRSDYIKWVIDVYANPSAHISVGSKDSSFSLKDYFSNELESRIKST